MSQIRYNNIDILFPQPTPLVFRGVTPTFDGAGERIGETQAFRLEGEVTGSYAIITGAMDRLTQIFSVDYKDLILDDGDGYTVTISGCKVNGIEFAVSTEDALQKYVVELESKPESYYKNAGIIDRRNSWSISQGSDGNFTISHEIFAKGINTAPNYDNALDNAKNFAQTLTGFSMPPLFPFFITGFSGSLESRSENINRLDGSYGISEQYIGSTGKVTKTVTVEVVSGNDGIISVGVNGTFRLGKAENFDLLRSEYSGYSPFATASGAYVSYRGVTGLLPIPLSSGVDENYIDNSLNFEVAFNDWPTTTYRHEYNVSVTSGVDGIISAAIDGSIRGLGKQNVRYDNAYNFYRTLNIFDLANAEYLDYVGPDYTHALNPYPIATGVSDDRFEGVIGYNSTWTDRDLAATGVAVKKFDISYQKVFAMRQISPISIINSQSGLDSVDLLWNSRGSITLNGEIVVDRPKTSVDATGYAAQYVNITYMSGVLGQNNKTKLRMENANITQNVNQDSCNFSVAHSFDEPLPISTASSYVLITGLRL